MSAGQEEVKAHTMGQGDRNQPREPQDEEDTGHLEREQTWLESRGDQQKGEYTLVWDAKEDIHAIFLKFRDRS